MEKLLKLLNEWYLERYGTNPNFVRFEDYGGNDYGFFCSPDDERLMIESEVWTKKYGFIEWLVQNDKIETEKVGEIGFIGKYDFETNYYLVDEDNVYDKCETLLMLLSISDTPIEDLISYLR